VCCIPFEFALHEAQTLKLYNFEWFAAYHPAFRFAPEVIAFWLLSVAALTLIARERALAEFYERGLLSSALYFAITTVRFIPWASFAILLAVKPWSGLATCGRPRGS